MLYTQIRAWPKSPPTPKSTSMGLRNANDTGECHTFFNYVGSSTYSKVLSKRGVRINEDVVKNKTFNASKTKKCITEGIINNPKLINGAPVYLGPQSISQHSHKIYRFIDDVKEEGGRG